MITKLLSTAVKFYLRSQVSQVEALQVKIAGKNRQILQGFIPEVFLSCQRGVYQGLHLRAIEVKGTDIAVNLPEVLKKKPLKLLEPIIVDLKLSLNEKDLQASINSPLLQSGLTDLWKIILTASKIPGIDAQVENTSINWNQIAIANNQLSLSGTYQDNLGAIQEFDLTTGIALANSNTLSFFPLIISNKSNVISELDEKLTIDLGQDVAIEQLTIEAEQILCLGTITIHP